MKPTDQPELRKALDDIRLFATTVLNRLDAYYYDLPGHLITEDLQALQDKVDKALCIRCGIPQA